MENVPSKPSAARVIFLARVNFSYEHTRLLSRMAKIFFSMLYQAVGGKLILGWVTFLGYLTLSSQGNFTQTDVVYPACVWLPSKCCKRDIPEWPHQSCQPNLNHFTNVKWITRWEGRDGITLYIFPACRCWELDQLFTRRHPNYFQSIGPLGQCFL